MGTDAPLGSFEEQVLLAVLRRGEDAYGMNVQREIAEVTGRDVTIGAVYATLDRLEAKRLVQSRRRTLDGASRRVFAVLPAGLRSLAESRAQRDRLWEGVEVDGRTRPAH
jgi:PadR family transcriptional regulator, regulatory protein PadR